MSRKRTREEQEIADVIKYRRESDIGGRKKRDDMMYKKLGYVSADPEVKAAFEERMKREENERYIRLHRKSLIERENASKLAQKKDYRQRRWEEPSDPNYENKLDRPRVITKAPWLKRNTEQEILRMGQEDEHGDKYQHVMPYVSYPNINSADDLDNFLDDFLETPSYSRVKGGKRVLMKRQVKYRK